MNNHRILRIIAAVAVPAAAAGGALFLYRYGSPSDCWFYQLTGLYCPGCGSGRAMSALVHGHLLTALGYNPLFCLILPLIAYYFAGEYIRIIFHRDLLPLPQLTLRDYHRVMFVVLGYGVLRNLPWIPFCLLAP